MDLAATGLQIKQFYHEEASNSQERSVQQFIQWRPRNTYLGWVHKYQETWQRSEAPSPSQQLPAAASRNQHVGAGQIGLQAVLLDGSNTPYMIYTTNMESRHEIDLIQSKYCSWPSVATWFCPSRSLRQHFQ